MINQTLTNNICKCCMGNGYQTNIQTGIREICKCCGGSGKEYSINGPIFTCRGE